MGNCAGLGNKSEDPKLNAGGINGTGIDLNSMKIKGGGSGLSKLSEYEQVMQNELNSGIFLEVQFHTEVPIASPYDISYKMQYSVFSKKWGQEGVTTKSLKSQPANFQYSY